MSRTCKRKGCETLLSTYNAGDYCWTHTLDLAQTERPAAHIKPKRRVTSTRFIANIDDVYQLTDADADYYAQQVLAEERAQIDVNDSEMHAL